MRLRRATMDDALEVLAWRNDPLAIAMSRTPGPIDQQSHMAWFARAVHDRNRIFLIALDADHKLGMVRFDLTEDAWLVSINIAPEQRGKGYGSRILNDGIILFHSMVGKFRLLAEVKNGNDASLQIFKRCGFALQAENEGWNILAREEPSKVPSVTNVT